MRTINQALSTLLLLVLGATALPAFAQEPFIGEIRWVGFNFPPKGWAMCDGQLLPISQNTALFSLLGTQYGGDGRTTFALPDLRSRTTIHQGQGAGLTDRFMGEQGGAENVTLLEGEMPVHSHRANVTSNLGHFNYPMGRIPAKMATYTGSGYVADDQRAYSSAAPNGQLAPGFISPSGGSQPHENMPPFTTLNCVIALQGVFPPRN